MSYDPALYTPRERQAVLLTLYWVECYEQTFHKVPWSIRSGLTSPKEADTFGAFLGVVDWMVKQKIVIDPQFPHWKGFIKYVLTSFSERGTIPCPAQLKNGYLLKKYANSRAAHEATQAAAPKYRLHPALDDPAIRKMLGI